MMQHRGMKGLPIATQARDGFRDRMRRITQASLKAATMKVTEMNPDSARWYCLHVKKGKEFDVENALVAANVEAYMPREKESFIRRGKKIDVVLPAVPGYLLVRLVPSPEAFLGLRHQNHVIDFVGGAAGYHVIHDVHVAVFKALFGDGEPPRVATDKTIGQGTEAKIVMGPFTGFRCVVTSVRYCREARASVRIDVDGRPFDIERISLAHLRKV